MSIIMITGGTGLVGKVLTRQLVAQGHQVTVLTRKPPEEQNSTGVKYALWDIKRGEIDMEALLETEVLIHLAGAGVVEKKWTATYKKEILDSRTSGMELIAAKLSNSIHRLKTVIGASAIGWYGPDDPSGVAFTESAPASADFLGETCKLWEASLDPFEKMGIRVCKLRTGIVLTRNGGALKEFEKPIRLGIAGILGNGKQMVSWIHIDDLCRMYAYAIDTPLSGSYNAVAPNPVTNKALTLGIAEKLKGTYFIAAHVPVFVLKLMLGERSVEVLKSCRVGSSKIKNAGFTFLYPTLEAALEALYRK